jgi:hypothetical protein
MRKAEKSHKCSECGGNLTTAFISGEYRLRCANSLEHQGIYKRTKVDRYPEYLKEEILKSMTTQLMKMDKPGMLQRVNQARWPSELTKYEKDMIADVAIQYGLDPLMHELSIYQGMPYVEYDGRMRKAQETKELDGIDTKPATPDEFTAFKAKPGDYLWRADVYKKGCARPFTGWGYVRAIETEAPVKSDGSRGRGGYRPTENNPNRMAEKRAEMFGLRKAFHLPLPTMIDGMSAGDEGDTSVPTVKDYIEGEGREIVDTTTGEIKTPPAQPQDATGVKSYPTDPASITTLGKLYQALTHDYPDKLATKADVLAVLGIAETETLKIKNLAAAYREVADKIEVMK